WARIGSVVRLIGDGRAFAAVQTVAPAIKEDRAVNPQNLGERILGFGNLGHGLQFVDVRGDRDLRHHLTPCSPRISTRRRRVDSASSCEVSESTPTSVPSKYETG